jgi:hypothetical protein
MVNTPRFLHSAILSLMLTMKFLFAPDALASGMSFWYEIMPSSRTSITNALISVLSATDSNSCQRCLVPCRVAAQVDGAHGFARLGGRGAVLEARTPSPPPPCCRRCCWSRSGCRRGHLLLVLGTVAPPSRALLQPARTALAAIKISAARTLLVAEAAARIDGNGRNRIMSGAGSPFYGARVCVWPRTVTFGLTIVPAPPEILRRNFERSQRYGGQGSRRRSRAVQTKSSANSMVQPSTAPRRGESDRESSLRPCKPITPVERQPTISAKTHWLSG